MSKELVEFNKREKKIILGSESTNDRTQKLAAAEARIEQLEAENEKLIIYKNLADEYGLSVFADLAELQKQRDELLKALEDAATSLETIALRSYGEESYLDSKQQMRGYARSRAGVARDAIVITSIKDKQ